MWDSRRPSSVDIADTRHKYNKSYTIKLLTVHLLSYKSPKTEETKINAKLLSINTCVVTNICQLPDLSASCYGDITSERFSAILNLWDAFADHKELPVSEGFAPDPWLGVLLLDPGRGTAPDLHYWGFCCWTQVGARPQTFITRGSVAESRYGHGPRPPLLGVLLTPLGGTTRPDIHY